MKKTLKILAAQCALLLLASVALAQNQGSLLGRVKEKKLMNGLTVLALQRPGAPVVSLQMAYKAGAVDEPLGQTGMAHLLEHMLFKGTKTIGTRDFAGEAPLLSEMETVGEKLDRLYKAGVTPGSEASAPLEATLKELARKADAFVVKGEFDGIYSRNGAVGLNASTSADLTNYFVSLPANRLPLWAALESDRMRNPVLREYYTERKVVGEERRERSETDPQGMLYQALLSTAFTAHPYGNPVIGWPSDLDTLPLSRTRAFYDAHYGPDNAVIAAVGDLVPEEFFSLVERHFGDIPARGGYFDPPTKEPAQAGPREAVIFYDAEPTGAVAFKKPTLPHRDDYVMDIIDGVLTGGSSSRLVRELVYRKKVLNSVSTANGLPGARYDNLFAVFFTPAEGVSLEEAREAVLKELERLSAEPPTAEEVKRVLTAMKADMVRALISDSGLARRLSYFQTVAGDWRYVETMPEVLQTITPAEVAATAARYFTTENRTTAFLRPKGAK